MHTGHRLLQFTIINSSNANHIYSQFSVILFFLQTRKFEVILNIKFPLLTNVLYKIVHMIFLSIFLELEVVGRSSDSLFQVGKYLNFVKQHFNGSYFT